MWTGPVQSPLKRLSYPNKFPPRKRDGQSSEGVTPRRYRIKLVLFFVCAIATLLIGNTAYRGVNTLTVLNEVEAERDQWQRPSDVIQALDLRPGNTFVDLGCG